MNAVREQHRSPYTVHTSTWSLHKMNGEKYKIEKATGTARAHLHFVARATHISPYSMMQKCGGVDGVLNGSFVLNCIDSHSIFVVAVWMDDNIHSLGTNNFIFHLLSYRNHRRPSVHIHLNYFNYHVNYSHIFISCSENCCCYRTNELNLFSSVLISAKIGLGPEATFWLHQRPGRFSGRSETSDFNW